MPRRPAPTALHDANRGQVMVLPPELGILCAVLQQALHDARSSRPDIRAEAVEFLTDATRLAWWGDVLGVESDALQQQVQALLGDAGG